MEDLDTQRTSAELGEIIREDLTWLGLTWDLETQAQSTRTAVYDGYFEKLAALGLLYPCYCTRSLLHSPNAPHLSDGTYVYPGTCRNLTEAERAAFHRLPAWRVRVPDRVCPSRTGSRGLMPRIWPRTAGILWSGGRTGCMCISWR